MLVIPTTFTWVPSYGTCSTHPTTGSATSDAATAATPSASSGEETDAYRTGYAESRPHPTRTTGLSLCACVACELHAIHPYSIDSLATDES